MIKGSEIRKADFPIDQRLLDRWSPRAMSGEEIAEEELMRLFEAARWAPSSFNAQQWRALYARRGTEHWLMFFDLLVEGNKSWAKNAAALVVFVSRKTFEHDGEPSRTHSYDTGAAWENLLFRASAKISSCTGCKGLTTNVREWSCAFPMNSRWKQWRPSANQARKSCSRKNYSSVRVPTTGVS
jgi:nitroreductase